MGCNPQFPVFTIYTGDAKTMNLAVLYDNFGGPVDLTDCTQIQVNLPNADGSFLQLTLTGGSGGVAITSPTLLGNYTAAINSDQSALLNVAELQTFTVTFTIGSEVFTVPYVNSLTVLEAEP